MISCGQKYHIGLQRWDRDSGVLPNLKNVNANKNDNTLIVLVESITNSFKTVYTKGEANLPSFNKVHNETYEIKIGSKGGNYGFEINSNEDWIILSETKNGEPTKPIKGNVDGEKSIFVKIDWDKIEKDANGKYPLILK